MWFSVGVEAPACYVSVVLVASGRVPVPCVVRLAVGPATNSCSFIERSCQSLPSFACWSAGRTFAFPVNLDRVAPHSPLPAMLPKLSTIFSHSG